ncbi:MAG: UDP-N-acetylmuramate dehydrogenase [Desulfopila sp.]|nr:UDP-N-acetylmuramate dehydrogenase [Desulfopila sp.]
MDKLCKKELSGLFGSRLQWNTPLADYTSFRIGGPADALVEVDTAAELETLQRLIVRYNLVWRVIGRGTNLLVRDQGFAGVVILLKGEFKKYAFVEQEGHVIAHAGAACGLSRLSLLCLEKGYSGLEFACGIPGTLGGAVMMNAGAWGRSMEDVVRHAEVMAFGIRKMYSRKELSFGYRQAAALTNEQAIVTSLQLILEKKEQEQIKKTCQDYQQKRRAAQPLEHGSAGSIFKNPPGESAGRLIEASGLKGERVGDAEVSGKHANFIVNRGKASAEDVLQLIERIQLIVKRDSGVFLEPEVHVL